MNHILTSVATIYQNTQVQNVFIKFANKVYTVQNTTITFIVKNVKLYFDN